MQEMTVQRDHEVLIIESDELEALIDYVCSDKHSVLITRENIENRVVDGRLECDIHRDQTPYGEEYVLAGIRQLDYVNIEGVSIPLSRIREALTK